MNEFFCTICKEGRSGTPYCPCNVGYFENSSYACQKCNTYCEKCTGLDACTVCSYNETGTKIFKSYLYESYCYTNFASTDGYLIPFIEVLGTNLTAYIDGTLTNITSTTTNKQSQRTIKYSELVNYTNTTKSYTFIVVSELSIQYSKKFVIQSRTDRTNTSKTVYGYYPNYYTECSLVCLTCQYFPDYCLSCNSGLYLSLTDHDCLSTCDYGYYGNGTTGLCEVCHSACVECFGATFHECSECADGYELSLKSTCFQVCNDDQYADYDSNECFQCDLTCATCNENNKCLTCAADSGRLYTDSMDCVCRYTYNNRSTTNVTCLMMSTISTSRSSSGSYLSILIMVIQIMCYLTAILGIFYQFFKNNSYFSKSLSMLWRVWLLRFLGVSYTENFYNNFLGKVNWVYKMDQLNVLKGLEEKPKKEIKYRIFVELSDTSLLENAGGLIVVLIFFWIVYFIFHYAKINRIVSSAVTEIEEAQAKMR